MKKVVIWLVLLLCLSGCTPARDRRDISHDRVIKIHITLHTPIAQRQLCYTDSEKIHRILHTLRLLGPKMQSTQPPDSRQRMCIQLLCADGSRKTYRLLGESSIQAQAGPWQRLQPGRGGDLYALVDTLPADPRSPALTGAALPELPCRRVYMSILRRNPIPYK